MFQIIKLDISTMNIKFCYFFCFFKLISGVIGNLNVVFNFNQMSLITIFDFVKNKGTILLSRIHIFDNFWHNKMLSDGRILGFSSCRTFYKE